MVKVCLHYTVLTAMTNSIGIFYVYIMPNRNIGIVIIMTIVH